MSIEVEHIRKTLRNAYEALQDVSLRIETGELVALLGPSGSGKTTLLRIIAGLELPDSGTIRLNDEDATQSDRARPAGRLRLPALRAVPAPDGLRKYRVRLASASESHPPSGEGNPRRVRKLLELIQLDWLGDRYPNQLSGGQRQRVALARALAVEPQVLLLDEPFGALDAKVRKELRRWLRRLHDELHVASVFVTHDQEEALEVSDRVAIMNHGKIEQVGTPAEVYDNPANAFVYQFLGDVNLFHGRGEGVGYARPYELDIAQAFGEQRQARCWRRCVISRPPARWFGSN